LSIRVIAVCVIRRADEILVFEGFDSVKGSPYYRPLGGGVEPGETALEAVKREMREELGREVLDLMLLGTLENIFSLEGEPGHEIVFVFEGRFDDEDMYKQEEFTIREDNGDVFPGRWRSLGFFDDHHRLVPEDLRGLLDAHPS